MKVFITGGTGFLVKVVVERLLEANNISIPVKSLPRLIVKPIEAFTICLGFIAAAIGTQITVPTCLIIFCILASQ